MPMRGTPDPLGPTIVVLMQMRTTGTSLQLSAEVERAKYVQAFVLLIGCIASMCNPTFYVKLYLKSADALMLSNSH